MNKAAILSGLLGFLVLSAAPVLLAQTDEEMVEAEWERRVNARQPPEAIMDAIGLKPGMIIADIGAGTGRVAVWLARRVGPRGKVYANDIDAEAVDRIWARAKRLGFQNVSTVVGKSDDPLLPAGALDIAFMTNVYHHMEKPQAMLAAIRPSLKPDGILVIVERDPAKSSYKAEATPREDMIRQLSEAGYEMVRIETFLSEDNIYIARPKKY
ncbi:MAG: class I SAM-dependent methyltransferase [Candidatus Aminicenantes bacterium]|nr:class I SAM-dependent methyltransferase [Candidatus Aminicenantes bacterium]